MQTERAALGEKWESRGGEPSDPAGLAGQLLGLSRPEFHLQPGDSAVPAQPAGDTHTQRFHSANASCQQQPWVKQGISSLSDSPHWYIRLINTHMNSPDVQLLIAASVCLQASQQSTSTQSLTSWHTWNYHSEFWPGTGGSHSFSCFKQRSTKQQLHHIYH